VSGNGELSATEQVEDIVYSIRKRVVVLNTRYCYEQYRIQRPSLTRASAQRMLATKVKKDPDDPTTGISILSVQGFNAI
jgi:hypothetical protein